MNSNFSKYVTSVEVVTFEENGFLNHFSYCIEQTICCYKRLVLGVSRMNEGIEFSLYFIINMG